MTEIHVGAGKTMLEALVRTPEVGVSELVWNAFDEDAKLVRIRVETNDLGGVEAITVEDDGNGMKRHARRRLLKGRRQLEADARHQE